MLKKLKKLLDIITKDFSSNLSLIDIVNEIVHFELQKEIIENFEKIGKTKFSNKNFAKFPSEIGFMQSSLQED